MSRYGEPGCQEPDDFAYRMPQERDPLGLPEEAFHHQLHHEPEHRHHHYPHESHVDEHRFDERMCDGFAEAYRAQAFRAFAKLADRRKALWDRYRFNDDRALRRGFAMAEWLLSEELYWLYPKGRVFQEIAPGHYTQVAGYVPPVREPISWADRHPEDRGKPEHSPSRFDLEE